MKNVEIRATLIIAMLLVTLFAPSLVIGEKNPPPVPPEDYIDPVTVKVREMKAKGMKDDQIIEALERLGMGYHPLTGATWIGRKPTPGEMQKLPPRKYPYRDVPSEVPSPGYQANQVMETVYFSYRGITNFLKPGTLAIKQNESTLHLVTTHVGRGGHWTEGGVFRWEAIPECTIFTYDDDEGGWIYHGSTDGNAFTNYQILVTTIRDSAGYKYNIWINGTWVRSGHLPYLDNRVDQANEVWSENNKWTADTIKAEHKDPYLYIKQFNSVGSVKWGKNIATNWWHAPDPCPVQENHYISNSAWRYITWV